MNKKIRTRIFFGNILLVLGFLINIFFVFNAIFCITVFSSTLHSILGELIWVGTFFMFFILGLIPYLLGIIVLWFYENDNFKLNIVILNIIHLISCFLYTLYFSNI